MVRCPTVSENPGVDLRWVVPLEGATLAIAFDALYLWVFEREDREGTVDPPDVVAGSAAAAAVVLVASLAIEAPRIRIGMLAAAAGLLAAWAVITSLSVGIFLLPAAVLALMALSDAIHDLRGGSAWLPVVLGGGFALAIVVIALTLTK